MGFELLFKYMKGRRLLYVFTVTVFALNSAMGVVPAYFIGRLVDNVLLEGRKELFLGYAVVILSITLARSLVRYFSQLSVETTSQTVLYNLRKALYDKLQKLDNGFFSLNPVGDIMAQMTGDLDLARHTLAWIILVALECVAIIIFSFVMLFRTHVMLTLMLFLFIPFIVLVNFKLFTAMKPYYKVYREAFQALDRTVQENIGGNRVVKAFAREQYELSKLREKSGAFRDCAINNTRKWLRFAMPVNILVNLMAITVLCVGAIFVVRSDITVGQLTMFTSLVWGLSTPLRLIGNVVNDTRRATVSLGKIEGLYYAWSDIKDPEEPVEIGRVRGDIDFQHVSLDLGGNRVLNDISFTLKSGRTLAVMGPTGAGKTTLVSLLFRMYDPSEGRVLLDGVDIRQLSLKALRENIGISMQDVFLFSDTIDGNIAYADPEMPEARVRACAEAAAASGFIAKMPEGYDTIIGERGVGLSGGQRQRIALARALARNAPVLILDDTTSAVDMETEGRILNSLKDINVTKIIVAQRVSSVKRADCIIVLEGGRITEMGTHAQLRDAGGWYSRICRIQEGEEEGGGEDGEE